MAQPKWKVTGKDNGLHIVQFDDGTIKRVTDSELHEMKTGLPLTDRESAKKLGNEVKALKDQVDGLTQEVKDLKGDVNAANAAKTKIQGEYETLEKERDKLSEDNKKLTQEVKDLKAAAVKDAKAVTAAPEDKAIKGPTETK